MGIKDLLPHYYGGKEYHYGFASFQFSSEHIVLDAAGLLFACAVRHSTSYKEGDFTPSLQDFQRQLIYLNNTLRWDMVVELWNARWSRATSTRSPAGSVYPGMQGGPFGVNRQQQQLLQRLLAGQQMGRMGMGGYGMPNGDQFNGPQGGFGPPGMGQGGMGSAGGNFGMDAPPHNQERGMMEGDIKEEGDAGGDNSAGAPEGMSYDQQHNFAPPGFSGQSGQEGSGSEDYERGAAI